MKLNFCLSLPGCDERLSEGGKSVEKLGYKPLLGLHLCVHLVLTMCTASYYTKIK